MFAIPDRIICPSTKERYPERSPGDYHLFVLRVSFICRWMSQLPSSLTGTGPNLLGHRAPPVLSESSRLRCAGVLQTKPRTKPAPGPSDEDPLSNGSSRFWRLLSGSAIIERTGRELRNYNILIPCSLSTHLPIGEHSSVDGTDSAHVVPNAAAEPVR